MGHSFGGTLTQILLDHGCGAAGVAIDSAPTEGVHVTPLSQIKSLFPVLKNPANRHRAVGFTPEEFHYAFTNTLSEEDSREGLRALPHPRARELGLGVRPVRQPQAGPPGDLGRLRKRRPRAAPVHRGRRGPHHAGVREPVERQALHVRTRTPTYHEFPGRSHWTCGEPGWEQVADYALDWAVEHARS